MMNEVAIRSFQIRSPWNIQTATDYGPLAREAWEIEYDAPDLDIPPTLTSDEAKKLSALQTLIPDEDAPFNSDTWDQVGRATDGLLAATKSLARGAHAYTSRWREERNPTTLTPDGLKVFKGKVDDQVYHYALHIATNGGQTIGGQAASQIPTTALFRDKGQPGAHSSRTLGRQGTAESDGLRA